MVKVKDYFLLHICIIVFSLTSVFSKAAANRYNEGGIYDFKNIDLHVAYANRSVYLIWAQLWAVMIFGEHLSMKNLIGLAVVLVGVIVVSLNSSYEEEVNE